MGWSKLYSEIVTSSIWSADDKTRIVWITLLALKDQNGFIPASIPGLANAARVSVPDCERAVAVLEAPDKYSRTPDHEGRRIAKVDGGWTVLNHQKYRDGLSDSPDAASARDRMRRMRDRRRKDQEKKEQIQNTDTDTGLRNVTAPLRNTATPKSFKQWTPDDLLKAVQEENSDGMLEPEEITDFVAYWMEPTPKGRSRMSLEKTWDTKRRMRTALERVYDLRRHREKAGMQSNRTPVQPIADHSKGF